MSTGDHDTNNAIDPREDNVNRNSSMCYPQVRMSVGFNGDTKIDEWLLFDGDMDQLMGELDQLRGTGRPSLVVTPNVDQVLNLRHNESLRRAYDVASVRLIDGSPLKLLARVLGARSIQRITGADLLVECFIAADRIGWKIAVMGGSPGSGERAQTRLFGGNTGERFRQIELPALGSPADPRSTHSIEALSEFGPDLVFVCLGSPKQEEWYLHWRSLLPSAVYIGAGAALDFAAGDIRRAPKVLQHLGLEWLWRLLLEPRRLAHRYLIKGPKFIQVVIHSWKAKKK